MQVIQLAKAGRGKSKSTVQADPTPERLAKAGQDIELGDDGHGHRVMTIRDSPLERALRRKAITEKQHAAGRKYYHHWYNAGLSGSLASLDADRIFAADLLGFSGMAKTEAQAFHRGQYRAAVQAIGPIGAACLEHIICLERPLADFGRALEWRSETRAIEAAETLLRRALGALVVLWGL